MTTKGVQLSEKMAPQTITPGLGTEWCAIVKAESPRCPGRLQTRLQRSSGPIWKRDSSRFQYMFPFSMIRTSLSHSNLARLCVGVSGGRRSGWYERKFRSISRL
ncbi:hypothetical protein TNCV_2732821 [Trichonephila clavipes]|nr:hypothetical protein TNCV_2732821 [Trichonephila clavipes]